MEPITLALTAFSAVQAAVKAIKQAQQTVDDVKSLGPLLGRYFDAKQEATKAVTHAKKKGGSNLGQAIEIELALKDQMEFERELQMLFFTTGNADVWQSVQQRVQEMNRAQAIAARKEREESERVAKEKAERMEIILISAVVIGAVMMLFGIIYTAIQATG